jgi:hypothetical protein
MNGSFLNFAKSHTPKISGSMLNIFLPKKAKPAVTHSAIIVAPLGFTPEKISIITLSRPTTDTFTKVAPIPPIAM